MLSERPGHAPVGPGHGRPAVCRMPVITGRQPVPLTLGESQGHGQCVVSVEAAGTGDAGMRG